MIGYCELNVEDRIARRMAEIARGGHMAKSGKLTEEEKKVGEMTLEVWDKAKAEVQKKQEEKKQGRR